MFTSQHEATGSKHLESVFAIVCVVATVETHRRGSSSTGFSALSLGVIQEEHGTPVVMQGLQWPKRPARTEGQQRAERPRPLPRGST